MTARTEYPLEDLSITVGGIRIDTCFSGSAELAEDTGYEFYVKSILLDGRQQNTLPSPFIPRRSWVDAKLLLERGAGSPEEQALFKLISDALYADEAACNHWRSEREAA
mgnify:FL=1